MPITVSSEEDFHEAFEQVEEGKILKFQIQTSALEDDLMDGE